MTSHLTLLGDRVVIKLDEASNTKIDGFEVPLFDNVETDGGRPSVALSKRTYLSQGTVLAVSEKNAPFLSPSDRVYVSLSAASPSNQFFIDRSKLYTEFDGVISIPLVLVEAKINV